MSEAAAPRLDAPSAPDVAAEPVGPEVVETVQKLPLRKGVTLRLTQRELSATSTSRTRRLRLGGIRSVRLEALRFGQETTRLVISGAEGRLVLFPGAKPVPEPLLSTVSPATFADCCLTRILAASPSVVLLKGMGRGNHALSAVCAVFAVIVLVFAVLQLLAGAPASEMMGMFAIVAMLPTFLINVASGKPREVSSGELRAEIARAFAPAAKR